MSLPEDFIRETRAAMGEELFQQFVAALDEEAPTSIRFNPFKSAPLSSVHAPLFSRSLALREGESSPIPWCKYGYYLKERPNFTFDPLLHAGLYYVQEASSMFIYHILQQYIKEPVLMLDLCAAPGGKTTCAMSALPEGSIMFSNEPIRNRAQILSENIQKFGHPDIIVTNSYPKDYKKSRLMFDVILCDVPCSGEGMFRKDENAVHEWSLNNVEQCSRLQRSIVEDAWHCLRPDGMLIYSTCTFNTHENEENVQWICHELDAELLPVETETSWNITGSLSPSLSSKESNGIYRFIPGRTKGEGLFVAVLRKKGESPSVLHDKKLANVMKQAMKSLHVMPLEHLRMLNEAKGAPHVALTYEQSISYLRHEAITLPPETPRGIVTVTYEDLPLGVAKNIGNRANNLYPKEWRIRSTHVPINNSHKKEI